MRRGRIHCVVVTPWTGAQPDGAAVVSAPDEVMRNPLDVADVGQETGSGGGSTDVPREPSVAFPRLPPVLDPPILSVQLPPEPAVVDTGKTAATVLPLKPR